MLAWVQLSPPDNATSSSVCVTGQLFPLLGIYLGGGDVDFKVFWHNGRVCLLNFWVQHSGEISVLVVGFGFQPMTDFWSSIGMSVLSFMNAHVGLQKVVTGEGCQNTGLLQKFNHGIKLLNKIRDVIKLKSGPVLNEDYGDVLCHLPTCIVLNPINQILVDSKLVLGGFCSPCLQIVLPERGIRASSAFISFIVV